MTKKWGVLAALFIFLAMFTFVVQLNGSFLKLNIFDDNSQDDESRLLQDDGLVLTNDPNLKSNTNAFVDKIGDDKSNDKSSNQNTVESLENIDLTEIQDFRIIEDINPEIAKKVTIHDYEKQQINDKDDYTIFFKDGENKQKILSNLENRNIDVTYTDDDLVHVKADVKELTQLASLEDVGNIEQQIPFSIMNDKASEIVEINSSSFLNLNGSTQVVGVIDTGLDTGVDNLLIDSDIHRDIDNRITNIYYVSHSSISDAADYSGHGTHVVGSIAGNGFQSDGLYSGIAPEVKVSFYAAGDDSGSNSIYVLSGSLLKDYFDQAYEDGARIHSNSWGAQSSSSYSQEYSKAVDEYVWDNKDFLPIFAAGNAGSADATLVFPGNAKNTLTIGASQSSRNGNINSIASFSSRGPTKNDGRVKPDVVAPGTSIISLRPNPNVTSNKCGSTMDDYYSQCSGTSMATPITSGFAVLVREDYVINKGYEPSASLIKATIIHGAQDIGYGMGSNETGWGRINLTNSLNVNQDRNMTYIDNTTGFIISGESDYNVRINVTNNSSPLKITLVWTDNYNDNEGFLVNDLDLEVSHISNLETNEVDSVYYGNNFDFPYNTSKDRINNVEQVIIETPELGIYNINISAYDLSYSNQTYSLIFSGNYEMLSSQETELNIFDSTSEVDNLGYNSMEINDSVLFYANYSFNISDESNMTNNVILSNATCNIYFEDLSNQSFDMEFNNSLNLFVYDYAFEQNSTYNYQITCEQSNYESKTKTEDIVIPKIYIPSKPIISFDYNQSSQLVNLHWGDVALSKEFRIYMSEDLQELNQIDVNDNPVIILDSSYNNYTINISNTEEGYVKVMAVNNNQYNSSNIFGVKNYTFKSGINLFSLPLNLSLTYNELASNYGGEYFYLIELDNLNKEFTEHSQESGGDYELEFENGYYVDISEDYTYRFVGEVVETSRIQLIQGINFVNLPIYTTAEQFLDLVNVSRSIITSYDTSLKYWFSHVKNTLDNDFNITPNGYEVYVPQSVNVTISLE